MGSRALPIRFKPEYQEITSSWLIRLAVANAVKLQTFCHAIWPSRTLWNLDIDMCPIEEILESLSQLTHTPVATVRLTSLAGYAANLSERFAPGNLHWILKLAKRGFFRRGFGQMFCPSCLEESCYLRKEWRLAFVTLCPRHQRILHDQCANCHTPLHFHRVDMGFRWGLGTRCPAICFKCGFDLRLSEGPTMFDSSHAAFQGRLLEAADQGWAHAPDGFCVYSHLYFSGLRQLVKLFLRRRRTGSLTTIVSAALKVEPRQFSSNTLEVMDVIERATLFRMVQWIIADWPYRFIRTCRDHNILSSTLLRDLKVPPFWLWRVINEHLYVVFTPWRSADVGPKSYSALVQQRTNPGSRREADGRRFEWVKNHRGLWKDIPKLARKLSKSGLYSTHTHHSQIAETCARFVHKCRRIEAAAKQGR
jgi:hypothetical protein